MKLLLCSALLVFTFSLNAQAPTAVPIPKEPHHHLVFENDYVRVFRVSIPGHEATLLHQHDVPYIYVSLGPADIINAVQGKPEAHLVMTDGQVGYSPGHFAHIARTDAGSSFENVTVELLKPQGEPRNLCAQVAPGAARGDCRKSNTSTIGKEPLLDTGKTTVDLVRFDPSLNLLNIRLPGLLIIFLQETQIQAGSMDAPKQKVLEGDVIWTSTGSGVTIWNSKNRDVNFVQIGITSNEFSAKPQ